MTHLRTLFLIGCMVLGAQLAHAQIPVEVGSFLQTHCLDCHSSDDPKAQLDLTQLDTSLREPATMAAWIRVHDRVRDGQMPPEGSPRPSADETRRLTSALFDTLVAVDDARFAREGRATRRRMNRYEYESTLRDLLDSPWLQIKQMLPEDGEAFRFNKVGDALDVSHVQIARYLAAADYSLRQVTEAALRGRPQSTVRRYYARDCRAFNRKIQYSVFNRSPERATFPIVGFDADIPVLEDKAPVSVGDSDPERRELEAMGVVASTYEPLEIRFDAFKAPSAGRYKLRFNAYSFWAGPESEEKWWRPSRTDLSKGRTREPISVYAETPPRQLRKIGNFEVTPEPSTYEIEVYLLEGETIRPDAVRLFRSRPPGPWRNPLAERDGQPGVAFRWLEAEGPLVDAWPTPGYQLLFDDLPVGSRADQPVVVTEQPQADAERLVNRFLNRVYREPAEPTDVQQFMKVIQYALDAGNTFQDAMIAGYSAVLCSPRFVTFSEAPGPLTDAALAARLSYFLWNSEPDEQLGQLVRSGKLREPVVLRAQTERLLGDPRSQRFVEAFLDYWLDLRKAEATSPDADLYPDYYLDDYLVDSAVDETRAFFKELLSEDLPVRNLIDSDFVMVNERLARHYGIDGVQGVAVRRVELDSLSPRGGLLAQASILKITANGTTTSPVLRGAWITERILGKPVPPPPAAVPAVEPDTRGATTIRQLLARHRTEESCQACHAAIDPPGFALESFDVLGGFRQHYRAISGEAVPEKQKLDARGFGKNGQPFAFVDGPEVDPSGQLDGQPFANLEELKACILRDERQVARNVASQLIVYGTGAPVRFGDRPELESILDQAQAGSFRLREMIHLVVASPLFQSK